MKPANPYRPVDWESSDHLFGYTHVHNRPKPSPEADLPEWDRDATYEFRDQVTHRGIQYACLDEHEASTATKPETGAHWEQFWGRSRALREPFLRYPAERKDIRHFNFTNHVVEADVTYPLAEWFDEPLPEEVIATPGHENCCYGAHWCQIGSTHPQMSEERYHSLSQAIEAVRDAYVHPDLGGVHLNHSGDTEWLLDLIRSYPDDVLGLEVLHGKGLLHGAHGEGDYRSAWDSLLQSGVQCWGFGNPDGYAVPHTETPCVRSGTLYGGPVRNVLLVTEHSEPAYLRAYRRGQFYVSRTGRLRFEKIAVVQDGGAVRVETDEADTLRAITDVDERECTGPVGTIDLQPDREYVRIEAESGSDLICSQPIVIEA